MTFALVESAPRSSLSSPTVKQLPTGLTIIAEQMPVESVNLSLWLGVGSAVEPDEINGMAHFMEHMIFKGTASLPSGEFERQVEQRGAIANAATSQDYTHYHITTAPKDFADLAPLQIEIVLNAAIPDAAFERERSVVLEEIRRSNDNPRRRNFYRAMDMAFDRLPYHRAVLGTTEIIEQLTSQQMRDFHNTWYCPKNITAVAVGNRPVDELVSIVEHGFATAQPQFTPIRQGDRPTETYSPNGFEPAFTEVVRQDYEDESLQQARLVMMWRVPGMANLQQTYALDVLAYVLGHGRMARLFRELREGKEWVTHISASNMTYARQGLFYVSAQLPTENIDRVEAAIAQQIQALQQDPISDAEINRVRTLVSNQYIFGNETPGNRSGLYGYYQTIVGDLTPALTYPDRIRALNVDELQAAAQRYLSATAYGMVVSKPTA